MSSVTLPQAPAHRTVTWSGLFLALFSLLLVREVLRVLAPNLSPGSVVGREAAFFACAAGLLLLVKFGEGLPMRSIGLGTSPWWKSLLWGLVTAVGCLVAAVMIGHLTGYGRGASTLDRMPVWIVLIVIARAGIVEELFYRGYAIERLQSLGLGRFVAMGLPLIVFGLGHYTGGVVNVVMALAMGAILTAFYWWRRDLVSNMIAHTLVDLAGNMLHRVTR